MKPGSSRRRLVLALAGAPWLVGWLTARAQPSAKLRRIGVLSGAREPALLPNGQRRPHAFVVGMAEAGYVEGRDYAVEWRFAEGRYERLGPFADELARSGVDIIVALNTRAVLEAQRATKTIPIVFASISDPLGSGIVTSLAHPGGNTTGISVGLDDTITKQLDLMRTTVRPLARLGVLINPDNPLYESPIARLQGVARPLGVAVLPFFARSLEEFPTAFAAMKSAGIQAVIVFDDSLFVNRARELAEAATSARLPTIAGNREYADAGVLYSYGGLIVEQFKRTAYYVDKIFKGAKPGDLPVEQPTRYFLAINQKTAKAIGLTLPPELLLRADASIE